MATLKITFKGICTHFSGVVHGVPHRVVLPDAKGIRFGRMFITGIVGEEPEMAFYTVPHFPGFVATGLTLSNGLLQNGRLSSPARVFIDNPADNTVTYSDDYESMVPSLRDFVDEYQYSDDVINGGHASCYFDITGGRISVDDSNNIVKVIATIETLGDPVLAVTAIDSNEVTRQTIGPELTVENLEVDRDVDDPPFDWALHYLTARLGIPAIISQPLPGMSRPFSVDPATFGKRFERLGHTVSRMVSTEPSPPVAADMTPSCSDSRYP